MHGGCFREQEGVVGKQQSEARREGPDGPATVGPSLTAPLHEQHQAGYRHRQAGAHQPFGSASRLAYVQSCQQQQYSGDDHHQRGIALLASARWQQGGQPTQRQQPRGIVQHIGPEYCGERQRRPEAVIGQQRGPDARDDRGADQPPSGPARLLAQKQPEAEQHERERRGAVTQRAQQAQSPTPRVRADNAGLFFCLRVYPRARGRKAAASPNNALRPGPPASG